MCDTRYTNADEPIRNSFEQIKKEDLRTFYHCMYFPASKFKILQTYLNLREKRSAVKLYIGSKITCQCQKKRYEKKLVTELEISQSKKKSVRNKRNEVAAK